MVIKKLNIKFLKILVVLLILQTTILFARKKNNPSPQPQPANETIVENINSPNVTIINNPTPAQVATAKKTIDDQKKLLKKNKQQK